MSLPKPQTIKLKWLFGMDSPTVSRHQYFIVSTSYFLLLFLVTLVLAILRLSIEYIDAIITASSLGLFVSLSIKRLRHLNLNRLWAILVVVPFLNLCLWIFLCGKK